MKFIKRFVSINLASLMVGSSLLVACAAQIYEENDILESVVSPYFVADSPRVYEFDTTSRFIYESGVDNIFIKSLSGDFVDESLKLAILEMLAEENFTEATEKAIEHGLSFLTMATPYMLENILGAYAKNIDARYVAHTAQFVTPTRHEFHGGRVRMWVPLVQRYIYEDAHVSAVANITWSGMVTFNNDGSLTPHGSGPNSTTVVTINDGRNWDTSGTRIGHGIYSLSANRRQLSVIHHTIAVRGFHGNDGSWVNFPNASISPRLL